MDALRYALCIWTRLFLAVFWNLQGRGNRCWKSRGVHDDGLMFRGVDRVCVVEANPGFCWMSLVFVGLTFLSTSIQCRLESTLCIDEFKDLSRPSEVYVCNGEK